MTTDNARFCALCVRTEITLNCRFALATESALSLVVQLVKVSTSFMAEVKTTLSFTKGWDQRRRGGTGSREEDQRKILEGWRVRGVVEMASKGPAVTMVLLCSVTVGTDSGRGEAF